MSALDRIREQAVFASIIREEDRRAQETKEQAEIRQQYVAYADARAKDILGPAAAALLAWEYDPAPPDDAMEAADAWLSPDTRIRCEYNHDSKMGWFGLVQPDGVRTEIRDIADLAAPLTDGGA